MKTFVVITVILLGYIYQINAQGALIISSDVLNNVDLILDSSGYYLFNTKTQKTVSEKYEDLVELYPVPGIGGDKLSAYAVKKGDKWGICRYDFKEHIPIIYDTIYRNFLIEKDGKYNYMFPSGKIIKTQELFDTIIPIEGDDEINGRVAVGYKENKTSIINSNGKVLLQNLTGSCLWVFYSPRKFGKNKKQDLVGLMMNRDGKVGVIDRNGNTVVPFEFDSLEEENECCSQKTNQAMCFCPGPACNAYDHWGKYYVGWKNGRPNVYKWKTQQKLMPDDYEFIKYYGGEKDFLIRKQGKYGVYRIDKSEIVPPKYESLSEVSEAYKNL